MTREDVGAVLVPDPEAVREALCGHQEDRFSGSFEQGIGCDRSPDFYGMY
jgi:hypothetical protein